MIKEKFTEKDYEMIDHCRFLYGGAEPNDSVKTEDYLSQFFANKEKLFNLLGNELIYSFPYEAFVSAEEMYEKLKYDEKFRGYISYFKDFLRHTENITDLDRWDLRDMIESPDIIKNKLSSDISYTDPNNHKVRKFCKGMKLMRALKELNEKFEIMPTKAFDEFRNFISCYTQDKTHKGTFYLSIHPLDYMTMSDNENDWSSCMSWKNEGDYRIGTVEMMNSPCVVVGYLANENDPYHIGDCYIKDDNYWNNKTWRCLYVITEEAITSVKDYPYFSPGLTQVGLSKLKELAEANLGWYYEDDYTSTKYGFFDIPETDKCISYETDEMYNDFGSTIHYSYFSKEIKNLLKPNRYTYINYSGPTSCCQCGQVFHVEDHSALCCWNCRPGRCCDECGCALYNDNDEYWVGDCCYCESCYNDVTTYIPYYDERVHNDEVITVCPVVIKDGETFYESCDTIYLTEYLYNTYFEENYKDKLYYRVRSSDNVRMGYDTYYLDITNMSEADLDVLRDFTDFAVKAKYCEYKINLPYYRFVNIDAA